MAEYKIGSSIIKVTERGKVLIFTEKSRKSSIRNEMKPSFEVFCDAEPPQTDLIRVKYLSHSFENGALKIRYVLRFKPVEVEMTYQSFEGSNALKVTSTLKNVGDTPVYINYISSSVIDNIGGEGKLPWYDDDRFTVHFCNSGWQKESQWQTSSLSALGVIPGTDLPWETTTSRFSSIGSFSTKKHYPLVMIEDKECGTTWFTEIECGCTWAIDVGSLGGANCGSVYLRSSAADETNGAWNLTLGAGESYTTTSAVIGCIDGGFEEVARTIIAYKRGDSLCGFNGKDIPVIFNDYMNCTWNIRDGDSEKRIIDAAAEAGCEIFCIDGGWQKNAEGAGCGDWLADDSRFGQIGLAGTLDYIKSKGMIPGVWFEWECCESNSDLYKNDGAILLRHSYTVNPVRPFVNFRDKTTTDFLESRVDELYRMGVRFIKNDYNRCTGIGSDMYGDSLGEGLIKNTDAFYSFIDRLIAKYPDLTIENCGSGGMREDNDTLRHFHLQSTSDQQIYYNYPTIICGTLAFMQPEKAGIWAYPYPALYKDIANSVKIDEKYFSCKDFSEETIFNMVSGICGLLYLSGRIDYCDEYNKSLIREAIDTYKSIRGAIKRSYPIFPLGQLGINKRGFLALGLVDEEEGNIFLAVWKINATENEILIDLSKNLTPTSYAKMLYPVGDKKVSFSLDEGKLRVKFPADEKYSARMLKIKI